MRGNLKAMKMRYIYLVFATFELLSSRVHGENFVMNLLHVNDHHSHLEESTMTVPLDGIADRAQKVYYGGYPRIVRLMRQAKNGLSNVVKIHAGDALVGTGYYQLYGSNPDVAMMNQVCFDVFNIGNHECEFDTSVLIIMVLSHNTDTLQSLRSSR